MAIFNTRLPLKFNPTTPVKIYTKKVEYIQGQGNTTTWEELDSDGYNVFYCEWRMMYGDRALTAEGLGVKESATVKTFYNPNIYNAIRKSQTLIIKNIDETAFKDGKPVRDNPNLYELWGGVDNILEENRYMEFRVRRYEGL